MKKNAKCFFHFGNFVNEPVIDRRNSFCKVGVFKEIAMLIDEQLSFSEFVVRHQKNIFKKYPNINRAMFSR